MFHGKKDCIHFDSIKILIISDYLQLAIIDNIRLKLQFY